MNYFMPSALIILIIGCGGQSLPLPNIKIQVQKHLQDVGIDNPQIESIQCTQSNTHGNLVCSVSHVLAGQYLTDLLMCNQQHGCREIPINDKGRLVLPVEECDTIRDPFNE